MMRQDVQVHTHFSDGLDSVQDVVESFIKAGMESVVITDHAKGWKNKNGSVFEFFPTANKFRDYLDQIIFFKKKYRGIINILSGLEIEIDIEGNFKLDRGILDYHDKNKLNKFGVDVLLGSIHSESFEEDCQERNINPRDKRKILLLNILNLIKRKEIDVLAHPFQAIHGHFSENFNKQETDSIIEAIFLEQKLQHYIFIEINGKTCPKYEQWTYNKYERGEMKTQDIVFLKIYRDHGGKFVLGSDTHDIHQIGKADFSILKDIVLDESEIHIFE